jgi:hypothetical protein
MGDPREARPAFGDISNTISRKSADETSMFTTNETGLVRIFFLKLTPQYIFQMRRK